MFSVFIFNWSCKAVSSVPTGGGGECDALDSFCRTLKSEHFPPDFPRLGDSWLALRMTLLRLLCLLTMATFCDQTVNQDRDFWYQEAREVLRHRLEGVSRRPVAKSVVLLVGDGLGVTTITAARIFKGQRRGTLGEYESLAWDNFPALALAKTYSLNAQVGESSACATALLCGVKANYETVGLDSRGQLDNCSSAFSSRVESLLDWAQQEGKATGLVTNTRVSHATPAALYAHSPSRYWEDDGKVPPSSRRSCKDITRQLVEDDPGRHLHVILGGGRRHWLPRVTKDPEDPDLKGRRTDGRNLVDDWLTDQTRRGLRAEYVWNSNQLEALNFTQVDRLLGLFAYSHMEFSTQRTGTGDPSLAEMTKAALSLLSRHPRGFFLFVESGRIDHAHHYNNAQQALEETLELESALLEVLEATDPRDTLVVLTSDHSHVLTFGGLNTPVGNPILGVDSVVSDVDGLPYSTLLYGNGPGYSRPRPQTPGAPGQHAAAAPRHWATHAGEDVPVYALGPLATALFSGTMDQSVIPHAVAYIACLGHYNGRCRGKDDFPVVKESKSCDSSSKAETIIPKRQEGEATLNVELLNSSSSAVSSFLSTKLWSVSCPILAVSSLLQHMLFS